MMRCFFFFNDTATTEIYTLSLHDALPIYERDESLPGANRRPLRPAARDAHSFRLGTRNHRLQRRSEEHTSELQSRQYLVCRLLLEKKKYTQSVHRRPLTTPTPITLLPSVR